MASQRLQKILAQAGVASRRSAERLITDGRVRVNGRIVSELGARANPLRDRVEVDGKRLVAEKPVYYLMHKPRGVVTTLDDPEGRKSVKDLLRNVSERVFPVGRLDFQTSGALLLTNDGAMAQSLLHPTRRVPKTYHAKVQGQLDATRLELLRAGVTLDDGERTAPAEVDIVRQDERHTFIEVTISEGKNRQIHRMLDAVGRVVLRLTRLSFAGLSLEGMRPGQMRPLTTTELNDLKQKYLNPSKQRDRRSTYREAWAEPREERSSAPAKRERRGPPAEGFGDPRGAERSTAPAKRERRGARDDRFVDPRGAERSTAPAKRERRGARDDRFVDPRGAERSTAPAKRERRGARGESFADPRDVRSTTPAKRERRGARGKAVADPRDVRSITPAKRERRGARGESFADPRDVRSTTPAKREQRGARGDSRRERAATGPSRRVRARTR